MDKWGSSFFIRSIFLVLNKYFEGVVESMVNILDWLRVFNVEAYVDGALVK